MDHLLATKSLPPGIRFHPTDEELFMFYLKGKVMGRSLCSLMISELDIYRFAPWDLPDKSRLKTKDLVWYFFSPTSRKFSHGSRTNRSTEGGYWKSTGNDRTVHYNHRPVGKIKTLIFHQGKAPKGERTDWVMHEYRLGDKDLADKGVPQDAYAICKVYKKSGLGPKNGEHYGAPFVEEDWESDEDMGTDAGHVSHHGGNGGSSMTCAQTLDSAGFTPSTDQQLTPGLDPQDVTPTETSAVQPAPVGEGGMNPVNDMEEDELDRLLAVFTEENTLPLVDPTKQMDDDIYNSLPDLTTDGFRTTEVGFNWSQWLVENDDCYVELNDLNENMKD